MRRWRTHADGLPLRPHSSGVEAEVLLAISRGFGKSLEWLLTGEEDLYGFPNLSRRT